jgi:hypothetical protein
VVFDQDVGGRTFAPHVGVEIACHQSRSRGELGITAKILRRDPVSAFRHALTIWPIGHGGDKAASWLSGDYCFCTVLVFFLRRQTSRSHSSKFTIN